MQQEISFATHLIQIVCDSSDHQYYLSDLRETMRINGLARAVKRHDSTKLVEWLVEAVSYQGISDAIASRYMDEHGRLSARQVERALKQKPTCPRLQSFSHFEGCRFGKAARTCAEPDHIESCPLPRHDLRNGRLNQVAYALTLFVRDVCGGDLVAWIDDQLAAARDDDAEDQSLLWRGALLDPLSQISGLSYKVLSMALADLLLGAGRGRRSWAEAGRGMVAIDILVHNWLARTGIMRRLGAEHAYGPACYRPGNCAAIIDCCTRAIDCRQFCRDSPANFPRFVQHAIWQLGSASGHTLCNGNAIDDRYGCEQPSCACYAACDRVAITPFRYVSFG